MIAMERKDSNCRYFQIGGLTIQVESDLPITDTTFSPRFKSFQVDGPGADNVIVKHHFLIPDLDSMHLGKQFRRISPWTIYKTEDSWIYVYIYTILDKTFIHKVVVLSHDYTKAIIYNSGDSMWNDGNAMSLTLLQSDQIILAPLLAEREGCFMHSSGAIMDGKGLLFPGRSGHGKSSMVEMLRDRGNAEILCEDRIIVRRWPEGYRLYGTWDHGGDLPESPNSGPLRAIMFLEKSQNNRLLVPDKKEITRRIFTCLVRPFVNNEQYDKTLALVEKMINEIPFYIVEFDKSGDVVDLLRGI